MAARNVNSEEYEFFFTESSESEDPEEDDEDDRETAGRTQRRHEQNFTGAQDKVPLNIVRKLINRETSGCFSGNLRHQHLPQLAYAKVPNRLSFCLKDIVPQCFLQGHMFMGLSGCGQFLLSYKVSCNDTMAANHYSFNIGYKYTLYFWTFQPHQPLRSFYKCCLFDDHGVDSLKEVTITQWKRGGPRVLIIHGAAEDENEDSYITYVKVPKLGCLECKKLRESEEEALLRSYTLCLKCNLTIHTKYSTTESDRKFNPYTNLICPDRILIIANGFMHMLHIDLDIPLSSETISTTTNTPFSQPHHSQSFTPPLGFMHSQLKLGMPQAENGFTNGNPSATDTIIGCDNQNNIVARIMADFTDIETDSVHSNGSSRNIEIHNETTNASLARNVTYDELIFTCSGSSTNTPTDDQTGSGSTVGIISHRGKRHHRIVTKSFRNGVITVDMQDASASSSNNADKSNAYEFSEDNEKCEKISILRKRRLADKKYEFSEDNSENIVPFTKIRLANKSLTSSTSAASPTQRSVHRTTPVVNHHYHVFNSPCASPSSSPHPSPTTSTVHRGSPILLSSPPRNSPVSANHMRSHVPSYSRSPQPHASHSKQAYSLSFKPLGALSPLQVSVAKRNYFDGSLSPSSNAPFLSPCRDELRITEVPIQVGSMPEKPICTKKFKRRYVEEDNAASVITSEEDDCISPGYHTSLPMEVHGSCYSEMQMISQASYQQLRCASVIITQHSFDLETFIYYVISTLCQKHEKIYDVFYDWACELIYVCPLSFTVVCLLMAQFSARDQLPSSESTNCLNCSRKLDCVFHRQQFECRILFTWNMESGECEVLDYGELIESKSFDLISPIRRGAGFAPVSLAKAAKKLAQEMAASLGKVQDYSSNLRVLDSNINKSKKCLTDLDAAVEFHRKRRQSNID